MDNIRTEIDRIDRSQASPFEKIRALTALYFNDSKLTQRDIASILLAIEVETTNALTSKFR